MSLTEEILIAIGLVFVIEGLVYSLFPGGIKKMAVEVLQIPESTLRAFGLGAMAAGVVIVWLIKG